MAKKLLLTGSLIAAVALGLTACSTPGDTASLDDGVNIQSPETSPSPSATSEPTEEPTQSPNLPDTPADLHDVTRAALDAIALAESQTGGIAYQLSDDDDETVWEIELNVDGADTEVHVSWNGAELLSTERDGSLDSDELRKLEAATVSIRDAIITASAHARGYVDDVDLDDEDGVVSWEIQFEDDSNEWDVYVNAQTGEVIRVDTD